MDGNIPALLDMFPYLFVQVFHDPASDMGVMGRFSSRLVTSFFFPELQKNSHDQTMKLLAACRYVGADPWRICLLVATLLHATDAANNTFRFPQNFSFSAATSSYQVEGGWNEGGKSLG
jgi:hypothetical protein